FPDETAASGLRTSSNLFPTVAFRENLHWIERPATVALFDLNRRQRAIGAGYVGLVRRPLVKSPLAPFERRFEVFRLYGPSAVIAGAFLDYFPLCVRQLRQHISGLVTDVLRSQMTRHVVVHFAGTRLEIFVELSTRRQFRKKFHRIHSLRADLFSVIRA